MATVKRPKGKKAEKDGSGDAAVTERDLWNLRTQLAAAEIRIDELEAQVFRLAHGGKEKEFFTVEETAEIWGVSRSALYVMIRDGRETSRRADRRQPSDREVNTTERNQLTRKESRQGTSAVKGKR